MTRPTLFAKDRVALFARLVANGLAQVATVLAAGLLASHLLAPAPRQGLWSVVAQLIACAVLLFALRWLERVDAARLAQSYVHDLRTRIFARLWHSHARETLRRGRGALLLRLMGDMGAIGRWIGQGLARIVVAVVMLAGVCAALLWMSPWLAAVAIALVGVTVASALSVREPLDAAVRAARAARGRLATDATDRLQALPAIQASGAWRFEQAQLKRRSRAVRDAVVTETRWSARLLAGSELIGMLAPLLAMVAVVLLGDVAASIAKVPAVVALFGLLVTPLRDSMRVFEYWRKAHIAYEKVEQMLNLPRLPRPRLSPPLPVGPIGELVVEGVVACEGGPKLNLRAVAGARVQLSGSAGSGRSELLRMLVRLQDPPQGRITVDGHDLRDVDLAQLRRRVVLVSASLGLQRGTVRRLITLRRPGVNETQLEAVLRRCHLAEWIRRMRNGLDTRLEEGWLEIPAAMRMRLLLAQALLAEPDVLLLDDIDVVVPPSHVHELRAMLAELRGIVVLVTSEARWRSWATQVWCLDALEPSAPEALSTGELPRDSGARGRR